MKIVAIRGSNLASLAGDFAIELGDAPLANAGVFAIIGNTGAGKSTLLDAMCLALFDRMPRLALRSAVIIGRSDDQANQLGAADVRGILRRGAAAGFAEVDFEGDDRRRYRARWSVRRARGKADGALQGQELSLTVLDTGEILGGKKTETLAAIRQRLGLSFDQFRRSVLLAQGDFAAFLRADGKERSELLERMTGTQIYSTISKLAHAQASDRVRQQQELRTTVAALACLDATARVTLQTAALQAQAALGVGHHQVQTLQAYIAWQQRDERMAALRAQSAQQVAVAQAANTAATPQRAQLQLQQMAETHRPTWQQLTDAQARGAAASARIVRRTQQVQQTAAQRGQQTGTLNTVESKLVELRGLLQLEIAANNVPVGNLGDDVARAELAVIALRALAHRLPLVDAWPQLDVGLPRAAQNCTESTSLRARLLAETAEQQRLGAAAKIVATQLQQAEHEVELAQHEAAAFDKRRLISPDTGRRNEDLARRNVLDLQNLDDIRTAALTAHADAVVQRSNLADLVDQQALRQTEIADAVANYVQISAVRDEAQRALQALRDVASLGHHRATLVNGEPCPLCGSCKHPWAKRDAIDDAIVAQQSRVEQVANEQQAQQQHRGQLEAMQRLAHTQAPQLVKQLEELQLSTTLLTQRWAAAHIELGLLQLIATPSDPAAESFVADQVTRATAALHSARAERERAEKTAQAATEALGVVSTRLLTAADLLQRQNHIALQLTACTVAIANADVRQDQLNAEFSTLWATLAPLLRQLQLPTEITTSTELRTMHAQLTTTWQRYQNTVQQATLSAAALAGHRALIAAALAVLAQSQAALVAADVADQSEAQRCADDSAAQRATLVDAALSHHLTVDQLTALFANSPHATAELARSLAALAQGELRARELGDERDRAWLEHYQTRPSLPASSHDVDAAQPNLPSAVELAAELTGAQRTADDLQQRYDHRRGELAVDDANVARREELLAQLGAAEQSATTIAALAQAIGSHDGKTFRAFAQGLTLDALLEQANHHLLGLAPRYALERVPAQDLEIQVVDRDMGDEIRGVASLSGGESFLISLALALGLSSLAAHSVRVQSLFIDEGFGTLDPATLDTALAVLDALQSSGRQVGIISHVPAIAERVGATIRIVNMGAGRSRVRVDNFDDTD